MNLRNLLTQILDCCYREPKLKLQISKEVHTRNAHLSQQATPYIFMVDGRISHGGMFDRLKGLISIYAIAKSTGKEFRISWTFPFSLEKYLQPTSYDWRIHEEEMNWSNYRNIIAYGEFQNPSRIWKIREKETHFYYGYNSLNRINAQFRTNYDWGKLYNELFTPTPYLQKHLDFYKSEIGGEYIAIHTRFMNLLGDKTETDINPELEHTDAQDLMSKAVHEIKKIGSNLKIMIASDSMTFISYVKKELPNAYIVPGTVKHIDTAGNTDDTENIKMFTDYYLISGAKKVYSLWHQGMWKSAFPEYAAMIGNVPFERIEF